MVGFVSFFISLVVGSLWVWLISGRGLRGHLAAVLFSFFWGCWGYVHFFAFCGMEPILYIALMMLVLCLYEKCQDFSAGCLLGAAALCRPEAVFMGFLLGLVPIYGFIRGLLKGDKVYVKQNFKSGMSLATGFAAVYGLWLLRCLSVNGTVFPSTVTMKSFGASDWHQIWNYARCFLTLRSQGSWEYGLIEPHVQETAWMLVRSWCPVAVVSMLSIIILRSNPRRWLPLFYPFVHFLFTFSKNLNYGDNMRYHVLDFTLVMVGLAVLLGGMIVAGYRKNMPRWAKLRTATTVLGLAISFTLGGLILDDAKYQLRLFKNMAAHFNILDYSIGKWLKSNTSPDTVVVLYQAGGIKFFGNRIIVDGGGVTDHTMFPYLKGPKNLLQAIVDRKADYIASFGDEWLSRFGLHMQDPRFFTPVRLRCRGLYKINKPALKAYAESLEAKETR